MGAVPCIAYIGAVAVPLKVATTLYQLTSSALVKLAESCATASNAIVLAGTMYLAGLSLQMADLSARAETANYATYLFVASIVLIVFIAIISLVKKVLLKPE